MAPNRSETRRRDGRRGVPIAMDAAQAPWLARIGSAHAPAEALESTLAAAPPFAATTAHRKSTAAEIREWFGNSGKLKLNEAQYGEIAAGLTKFRWPADPPSPAGSHWIPKEIESDPNRWWDFRAATDELLMGSVLPMLSHWEGQRWAPETRGGYDAIKSLGDALFHRHAIYRVAVWLLRAPNPSQTAQGLAHDGTRRREARYQGDGRSRAR